MTILVSIQYAGGGELLNQVSIHSTTAEWLCRAGVWVHKVDKLLDLLRGDSGCALSDKPLDALSAGWSGEAAVVAPVCA